MSRDPIAAEAAALPREPTARWIRVLVCAVTVVWIVALLWQVRVLPEQVPTHFGAGGRPDGWSSRAGALAFSVLLPLVLVYPLPLLSRLALWSPSLINAPHRDWWSATAPRLRRFERLVREDLWLIAMATLGLLLGAQVEIVLAARGSGSGIGAAGGPLLLVPFLLVVGVVVARMAGSRYALGAEPDAHTN